MTHGVRHSPQIFIEAIPGTGGIITTIATRVGCAWHTAKKFIDNHPEVYEAWTDERERMGDLAETKLFHAIAEGDIKTIKWYLARLHKDRGYVIRQEVEHSGTGSMDVRVTFEEVENWRGQTNSAVDLQSTDDAPRAEGDLPASS